MQMLFFNKCFHKSFIIPDSPPLNNEEYEKAKRSSFQNIRSKIISAVTRQKFEPDDQIVKMIMDRETNYLEFSHE